MRVALLSNVNTDYVLRLLAKEIDCIDSVGYGNVWGQLLDKNSSLNQADPGAVVFLMDIEQLTEGCSDIDGAKKAIDEWYSVFDTVIRQEKDYFVSEVLFRSGFLTENDSFFESQIIGFWMDRLEGEVNSHSNVHVLKLNGLINENGKKTVFSDKMWYMGKIPFSNEGCRIIAEAIRDSVLLLDSVPKKVLILDLDNTLWGGILGELGAEGIELSDDHIGAVYKRVQRQIKAIKGTGIVLAIASKNNESDVQEVWDRHPHMVLKRDDFVSIKINWADKAENLLGIAKELNLGLDSFVFIDDMATERENIRMRLPDVVVPEFPNRLEDYPAFIETVYNKYFRRIRLSAEDKVKTQQYVENTLRQKASEGLSFEEYLSSIQLVVNRVELDDVKLDRVAQMHGKTNQFNLTTIRYTRQDIDRLLRKGFQIFAYNVSDRFGDYGLVAAVIVDRAKGEINSFLMSCRVMGKLVENYVINDVEQEMLDAGCSVLRAKYIKTGKNAPVEKLFDNLGYRIVSKSDSQTEYEIDLKKRPKRQFFVNENQGGEERER